jgi:hypothetical protein
LVSLTGRYILISTQSNSRVLKRCLDKSNRESHLDINAIKFEGFNAISW